MGVEVSAAKNNRPHICPTTLWSLPIEYSIHNVERFVWAVIVDFVQFWRCLSFVLNEILVKSDDIKQTRRRLSVMSDNKLVEGIESVNINENPEEEVVWKYDSVLLIYFLGHVAP